MEDGKFIRSSLRRRMVNGKWKFYLAEFTYGICYSEFISESFYFIK